MLFSSLHTQSERISIKSGDKKWMKLETSSTTVDSTASEHSVVSDLLNKHPNDTDDDDMITTDLPMAVKESIGSIGLN